MKPSRFAFFGTTTFRLALLYAILFALFSAGLMVYLYQSTVVALRSETQARLLAEYQMLSNAWNSGGPVRLEQSLLERSLISIRDFTYQFEDGEGRIIVGDLPKVPFEPFEQVSAPRKVTFEVERPVSEGAAQVSTIEGWVVRLGDNSVLLVGIKMDERIRLVNRITQAVATAAPIGFILALLGGYFSARYAARRAETLSRTAEGVMAGDLSLRIPVVGSGDEFDRLAIRLNAMLSRLETLMASTRHAGNAIAHDLRSPLSRLRNQLETRLRGPLDEISARETLAETVEEVDHVLSTFNAILRLSRIGEGAETNMQSFSLSETCEELAELFGPACEDACLGFHSEITPEVIWRGDRSLIAQAISNLLDNAIKYTPAGQSIQLRLIRADQGLHIDVEDTGPGIPLEDMDRVKQRFVRLDQARTQVGTGLGLALVEAVAELHKGRFILQSGNAGQGLCARLILPDQA